MADSDGESCDSSSSGEGESPGLYMVLEDNLPSDNPPPPPSTSGRPRRQGSTHGKKFGMGGVLLSKDGSPRVPAVKQGRAASADSLSPHPSSSKMVAVPVPAFSSSANSPALPGTTMPARVESGPLHGTIPFLLPLPPFLPYVYSPSDSRLPY